MSNAAVLGWVQPRVGHAAVGDGECFALVDLALRETHHYSADRFGPVGLHDDYVWGVAVPLAHVEPGDVAQFRDFEVRVAWTWETQLESGDGPFFSLTRPHHSAIVETVANRSSGEIVVIEQNVSGSNNGEQIPIAIDPESNPPIATVPTSRVVRTRLFVVGSHAQAEADYGGQHYTIHREVTVSGRVWFYRPQEVPQTSSWYRRPRGAPLPFGAPSRWA